MANVTIGRTEYEVPEMNFLAIERAWPFVLEATNHLDPIAGTSAAISVIAAGLMEADGFKPSDFGIGDGDKDSDVHRKLSYYLKKQLKASELVNIKDAMLTILKEAGLEVTEGGAIAASMAAPETAAESPSLSPETAPSTSSSSSQPDAKEEAGTQ